MCCTLLDRARRRLKDALKEKHRERTLRALSDLKVLADNKDCYSNGCIALDLLFAAVSPLDGKHGGDLDLDDEVVKESMAVACLLLKNAQKVHNQLRNEISSDKELKTSLERIRDYHGSGSEYDEVRNAANEILKQLP